MSVSAAATFTSSSSSTLLPPRLPAPPNTFVSSSEHHLATHNLPLSPRLHALITIPYHPHVRYHPASSRPLIKPVPGLRPLSITSHSRPRSLTLITHTPNNSTMSLDDMPDSPPDLSSSKSSTKSDSLHSTGSISAHDHLADISHFEDISLADGLHARPSVARQSRLTAKPRPLIKTTQTTPATLHSPRYNKSTPNLRNGLRLSPIHGHRNVRSPMRSPSSPLSSVGAQSPSLTIPNTHSGRSPSPRSRRRSAMLPRASSHTLGMNVNPPRMQKRPDCSAPRKRKTTKEIEDEYEEDNDEDEDLPNDFIIANIPLSPRPPSQTPGSSENTSPERAQSSCSSDSQSKSINDEHRAKSWDAAMLGLSLDVRELSSKLDLYNAEEYKRHSDPQPPRPTMNPRSVTLPPIQRGDAMIDPLPCSKEKEKHLSRTRPGWLPPKSRSEEKKHLQQYKQIMSDFLAAEKRKSQEQEVMVKTKEELESSARRTWEMHILPQWDTAMTTGKARHLWWQGIPANLRGKIWARAIGNDLHLSHGSYEAALARAKALQQRLETASSTPMEHSDAELHSNARSERSISAQKTDADSVFPEHKLFQVGQTFHTRLRDVLAAYAAYRSDTGHVTGIAGIAALLLIHVPEPGRCFVALANLLNRPVSLAFCLNDAASKDRTFSHILRGLKYKVPQLHEHLSNKLGLKPDAYLGFMCRSLLTGHLEMAEAARVFDILVFEGDGVLVRAVVAYFARNEASMYGSGRDVLDFLSRPQSGRGGVNALNSADSIIDWVRWAGKEDVDRPKPQ